MAPQAAINVLTEVVLWVKTGSHLHANTWAQQQVIRVNSLHSENTKAELTK